MQASTSTATNSDANHDETSVWIKEDRKLDERKPSRDQIEEKVLYCETCVNKLKRYGKYDIVTRTNMTTTRRATRACFDCNCYLCDECSSTHTEHFLSKSNENPGDVDESFDRLIDDIMKETAGDRKHAVGEEKYSFTDILVDGSNEEDVTEGIVILKHHDMWVISDSGNNCIKIFNVFNNKLIRLIKFPSSPLGVTDMTPDITSSPTKASMNFQTEPKEASVNSHMESREASVNSHMEPKNTTVNSHTESRETSVNSHMESNQASMNSHMESNEASMHSHMESKEASMNYHMESKEAPVNSHMESKEASVNSHTESREASMNSQTASSECTIAVTFPDEKKIVVIDIHSFPSKVKQVIDVQGYCRDIFYCQGKLVTHFSDSSNFKVNHSIHIIDGAGVTLNVIKLPGVANNPLQRDPGYCVTVHPETETIYAISIKFQDVMSLDLSGQIINRYFFANMFPGMLPDAICVDSKHNVYVACSFYPSGNGLCRLSADLSQCKLVFEENSDYIYLCKMTCYKDAIYSIIGDYFITIIKNE